MYVAVVGVSLNWAVLGWLVMELNPFFATKVTWAQRCGLVLVQLFLLVLCSAACHSYAQTDSELKNLIDDFAHASDFQKLEVINEYFNQLKFDSDTVVWGQDDYWATPHEFINAQAGDCEDFSMAKYFALKHMGISERSIRLAYVRLEPEGRAHMVLAYYPEGEEEPQILDNTTDAILRLSQRPDLTPAYSFNADEIWLGLPNASDPSVGNPKRLSQWQQWLKKANLPHS